MHAFSYAYDAPLNEYGYVAGIRGSSKESTSGIRGSTKESTSGISGTSGTSGISAVAPNSAAATAAAAAASVTKYATLLRLHTALHRFERTIVGVDVPPAPGAVCKTAV